MGYGSRAIDLLLAYFQGQLTVDTLHPASGLFGGEGKGADPADLETAMGFGNDLQGEEIKPKAKLPPLLTPIAERPAELLHWFGASFGLTSSLLNFWSRKGFKVCYLRQTRNELTGEHSAIVLRELEPISGVKNTNSSKGKDKSGKVAHILMENGPSEGWLAAFVRDYRRRLISLMSYSFTSLEAPLAITLLDPDRQLTATTTNSNPLGDDDAAAPAAVAATGGAASSLREAVFRPITAQELLSVHLSHHDMQRLELYSRNMVDHHMILDTLPILTQLLFQGRMPEIRLSYLQVAIILATGLQHRDVDSIATELNLPANQVLAFFNKTVRKITSHLRGLVEADAALTLPSNEQVHRIELNMQGMTALAATLDQDQRADELDFNAKMAQRNLIMGHKDLAKHAVGADLGSLEQALKAGLKKQLAVPKMVSVPKANPSALPALSAEDLVDDDADAAQSGKKRPLDGDDAAVKTPSKHSGGKDWKTDKKKDKSGKKSKRESI
jgi:N-acetyltransferase 10